MFGVQKFKWQLNFFHTFTANLIARRSAVALAGEREK